jgi:hypothetical protein
MNQAFATSRNSGETSSYYYLADTWPTPITLILRAVVTIMSRAPRTLEPVSEMVAPLSEQAALGELNFEVKDVQGILRQKKRPWQHVVDQRIS